MTKKIVVVNAGPRQGWNTDTLLKEAANDYDKTDWPWSMFDAEHKKTEA